MFGKVNLIQSTLQFQRDLNLKFKNKSLNYILTNLNMIFNNPYMKALYFSSTDITTIYLYPILMGIFHNKILVLIILAFI